MLRVLILYPGTSHASRIKADPVSKYLSASLPKSDALMLINRKEEEMYVRSVTIEREDDSTATITCSTFEELPKYFTLDKFIFPAEFYPGMLTATRGIIKTDGYSDGTINENPVKWISGATRATEYFEKAERLLESIALFHPAINHCILNRNFVAIPGQSRYRAILPLKMHIKQKDLFTYYVDLLACFPDAAFHFKVTLKSSDEDFFDNVEFRGSKQLPFARVPYFIYFDWSSRAETKYRNYPYGHGTRHLRRIQDFQSSFSLYGKEVIRQQVWSIYETYGIEGQILEATNEKYLHEEDEDYKTPILSGLFSPDKNAKSKSHFKFVEFEWGIMIGEIGEHYEQGKGYFANDFTFVSFTGFVETVTLKLIRKTVDDTNPLRDEIKKTVLDSKGKEIRLIISDH
jgi:hypothetical protein